MEPIRWIRGVIPVAALLLVGAGVPSRPPILAAADPPWQPPSCGDPASPGGAPAGARRPDAAWYRLDGVLDDTGTLAGNRLFAGTATGPARHLELPPESFATGPVGSVVLVGTDDGRRSTLSLLDVARGCITEIETATDVVRSALLAPDGRSVVEHRVDRVTRADLGTWRVSAGAPRPTRLLPPPPADGRYGRTFATELRWTADGDVAVTSCGEIACRTRFSGGALAGGTVGPTGPVVGATADGVVAHAPCPGFPCALLRYEAGGGIRLLVAEAGRAAMAGSLLVAETGRGGLAIVDPQTGAMNALPVSGELVPMPAGSRASAGATAPGPAVLLAPRGRVAGGSARLLAPGSTSPMTLEEISR